MPPYSPSPNPLPSREENIDWVAWTNHVPDFDPVLFVRVIEKYQTEIKIV
ncbi:MAG: hypothetical protein IMF10_08800 [Proteobacteria bacterium]|nr:hypothetical protein [Pseudomonadota bacterium]